MELMGWPVGRSWLVYLTLFCSFCFRYIKDFIFKMTAYSHADRVRSKSFLDPDRIQTVICEGVDVFEMLPEEYTFRELLTKMGSVPKSYSAVHFPSYLLENYNKFLFLFPGNCIREPGWKVRPQTRVRNDTFKMFRCVDVWLLWACFAWRWFTSGVWLIHFVWPLYDRLWN